MPSKRLIYSTPITMSVYDCPGGSNEKDCFVVQFAWPVEDMLTLASEIAKAEIRRQKRLNHRGPGFSQEMKE